MSKPKCLHHGAYSTFGVAGGTGGRSMAGILLPGFYHIFAYCDLRQVNENLIFYRQLFSGRDDKKLMEIDSQLTKL